MRQSATAMTEYFIRRARGAVRAAALLVGVAALTACASSPSSRVGTSARTDGGGASAQPSAPIVNPNGPVIIALLAPTTAPSPGASQVAQDLTAAAQIALSEHAPANLTMKIYDTNGNAADAAVAVGHAVRDGAALILGPLLGESTAAVAPVAAQAGLNVISFSNDASVAGGNVWVLGQLPGDEMRRLFSYAGSQGVGSIALLHPQDRYGQAVASAAPEAGRSAGVRVRPILGYQRSFEGIEGSSQANASEIRASGVDGVLITDTGDALRSVAAFLGYHDVSPRQYRYLGLSRWDDPTNASESVLQGGWYVSADPERHAAFADKFAAMLNRRPSPLATIGYDAVVAAADIVRAAAAGGPPAFSAAAITASAHDGATGVFRLTRDGLNRRSFAVMEITKDGPITLDPAPTSAPGA